MSTPVPAVARDAVDAPGLRALVAQQGAVVVQDVAVGDDHALLDVARAFGEPSRTGNGSSLIYAVTPKPDGRDLSETAHVFPLHTDSTFMEHPHDAILLGCLQAPADGGGESVVVRADALVAWLEAHAAPGTVEALAEPVHHFLAVRDGRMASSPWPVLEHDDADWAVRYRADALERGALAAGERPSPRHAAALEALEQALAQEELQLRHRLAPGEVLAVDNRHALHGRTAILEGSPRHLRRVKVEAA